MRLVPRYRIRTLLIAAVVVAIGVAITVNPIISRRRAIERLRRQDVRVFTTIKRPSWLGSVTWLDRLFEQTNHSTVLIQPVGEAQFRVLGKDMTYDETADALKQLRLDLKADLGNDRIMFAVHGDFPHDSIHWLFDLCSQHDSTTSGGAALLFFPDSALIDTGLLAQWAEQSDAPESASRGVSTMEHQSRRPGDR